MRSRERVLTSLRHEEPDRVPVDFLATPDVWDKLVAHVAPDAASVGATVGCRATTSGARRSRTNRVSSRACWAAARRGYTVASPRP